MGGRPKAQSRLLPEANRHKAAVMEPDPGQVCEELAVQGKGMLTQGRVRAPPYTIVTVTAKQCHNTPNRPNSLFGPLIFLSYQHQYLV